MAKLGGGRLLRGGVDRFPRPAPTVKVGLSLARLRRVSGNDYALDFAQKQLTRLGMGCAPGPDGLVVTIPSYRPDLTIAEDLVEEILRMGEYGKPARKERIATNATERANPESPADRARVLLAGAGLAEIVTWAFVPKSALAAISGDGKNAKLGQGITLRNPISTDYEVMRTSLLPGLADALKRNLSRGVTDASLFEVGTIVRRGGDGAPVESTHAAGLLAGRRAAWLKPGEPLDFYDLKSVVETVLARLRHPRCELRVLRRGDVSPPGRLAPRFGRPSGAVLGSVGEIHPRILPKLGIETAAFYLELDVAALAAAQSPLRTSAPPRFPAVTRDVSFWIDAATPAAAQRAAFLAAGEPLLVELAVLEDFRDPKYVPAGQKGVLWTMTYRAADRTLTDAEVDAGARSTSIAALAAAVPDPDSLRRELNPLTTFGLLWEHSGHDEGRHRRDRLREGRWLFQERGGRDRRDRLRHHQGHARAWREDQDLGIRQLRGARQELAYRPQPADRRGDHHHARGEC